MSTEEQKFEQFLGTFKYKSLHEQDLAEFKSDLLEMYRLDKQWRGSRGDKVTESEFKGVILWVLDRKKEERDRAFADAEFKEICERESEIYESERGDEVIKQTIKFNEKMDACMKEKYPQFSYNSTGSSFIRSTLDCGLKSLKKLIEEK